MQGNNMIIKIHRGTEEIGGNCIELQSGDSRILLDYGTPLPRINPLTHRSENVPLDETEHKIEGLYGPGKARLDGLIISHHPPGPLRHALRQAAQS